MCEFSRCVVLSECEKLGCVGENECGAAFKFPEYALPLLSWRLKFRPVALQKLFRSPNTRFLC